MQCSQGRLALLVVTLYNSNKAHRKTVRQVLSINIKKEEIRFIYIVEGNNAYCKATRHALPNYMLEGLG